MSVKQTLDARLQQALDTTYLTLTNESHRHNVPAGSETHFSAVIVSSQFESRSLLQRHRAVHEAMGDDLGRAVHAFTMRTLTPEEWERESRPQEHQAPPCRGGSKSEIDR